MNASDLKKSFPFDKTVKSHMLPAHFDSCVKDLTVNNAIMQNNPYVLKLERFQTDKVTFNVTQGH